MTRALAIARPCVYAALVAGAVFAPDIARALALAAPAAPVAESPALFDTAARSLGWLSAALTAGLAKAGFAGLAFGTALALAGTLALVEWRARRVSSPPTALAAVVLAAACSLDALHIGGGASNGLFFAALLVAFDLSGTRGIVAIAVVAAVWCNASPAGILAPFFALALVLGAAIDRVDAVERRRVQLGALVAALATLATPAFLGYPLAAWRAIGLDNATGDLLPAVPSVATPLAYQAGVILTIVVALAVGARSSRAGTTLAFAFAAYLGFSKGAFVPFVGIAGAPLLAESAARLFTRANAVVCPQRSDALRLSLAIAAIALVAGIVASRTLPTVAAASVAPPFGILERYAREKPSVRGRLLCTKLTWCDVAERRFGLAVIADSRIAALADTTIEDQRMISAAKKGWAARARARSVDAIFVDARSGFATLLVADGWRAFGTDGNGSLFVRTATTL